MHGAIELKMPTSGRSDQSCLTLSWRFSWSPIEIYSAASAIASMSLREPRFSMEVRYDSWTSKGIHSWSTKNKSSLSLKDGYLF